MPSSASEPDSLLERVQCSTSGVNQRSPGGFELLTYKETGANSVPWW